MIGRCTVCGDHDVEVRHLEIYVIGSEGCECCVDCGIALSEHVRQMMLVAAKASKRGYKAAKMVAEAKKRE